MTAGCVQNMSSIRALVCWELLPAAIWNVRCASRSVDLVVNI